MYDDLRKSSKNQSKREIPMQKIDSTNPGMTLKFSIWLLTIKADTQGNFPKANER